MVKGHRKEKFQVALQTSSQTLISDVKENLGGTDLGPDPHELLEASLVACTVITVQMYADHKKWNLQSTEVQVKIDKEGADSHILREIRFTGDLTEEQRTRLMEIANKCPIHKLLTGKIEITTRAF